MPTKMHILLPVAHLSSISHGFRQIRTTTTTSTVTPTTSTPPLTATPNSRAGNLGLVGCKRNVNFSQGFDKL